MKRWLVLLAVLLLGYLLTGIVQILPGEQAVVRRFGRVLPDHPGPGLWIGFPYGIDRVERVPVDRIQSVSVGYRDDDSEATIPAGQVLTGDHNLVNVQATLTYKVQVGEIVHYVTEQERVPDVLAGVAESVLAEWVAGRAVDEVLLQGKLLLPKPLVERTRERLKPYHLGIEVLGAQIGLIAPPEDVKPSFDSVSRAQTTIATRINNAQQQAESQERNAEAERYRTQQVSAAEANARIVQAQGEADNFRGRLREYERGRKHNPNYLRQIWEEERGKLFARLKENKQLGILDHHLGADGLDLSIAPSSPRKEN